MKVYPYIKDKKRIKYCEKIEKYCNTLGGNYIKLNQYFNKYWKKCELFNFTKSSDKIFENRTNNICESFHHKFNQKISHYHPKISFLVQGLKNITREYYDDYIKALSSIKTKKKNLITLQKIYSILLKNLLKLQTKSLILIPSFKIFQTMEKTFII